MTKMLSKEEKVKLVSKIRYFFNEFYFESSNSGRFINTLYIKSKTKGFNSAYNYVLNYFKLINNNYIEEVKEKLKSAEFKVLIEELKKVETDIIINNRLCIYFGDAGTGKTTQAINQNPGAPIMLCSSDYESDDLFRTFDFEDAIDQLNRRGIETNDIDKTFLIETLSKAGGMPHYKPSDLRIAMEEGKPIILEELNLLTSDCHRTLQGVLDNKECFIWKGEKINIAPGFKIIATMNLSVNNRIYELPTPLVDRAYDLQEFCPTNEFLSLIALGD